VRAQGLPSGPPRGQKSGGFRRLKQKGETMSAIKKCLDAGSLAAFAGGVAAAIAVPRILKSKCARKAAVYTMAKGLQLQEDAVSLFDELREDAQDLYYEAKGQGKDDSCEEKED
jgi:hypothetical protein